MSHHHKPSIWAPGCGRPHPEAELIKQWAEGKITLIEKQRVSNEGKPYGEPVRVQYPCWNPEGWLFEIARNTQLVLDLDEKLVSTRKIRANQKDFPKAFKKPVGNWA